MLNRLNKISPASLWVNGKFKCLIDYPKIGPKSVEFSMENDDYYPIFENQSPYIDRSYQLGISMESVGFKVLNSYVSETSIISNADHNSTKANITIISNEIISVRPKDIPPKCKECYGTFAYTHENIVDKLSSQYCDQYLIDMLKRKDRYPDMFGYTTYAIKTIINGHFPHLKNQFDKLVILL